MKKVLIVTTISGFLPQFEMHDVDILQSMGYEVHYASNFDVPVYDFSMDRLREKGIIIHPIPIAKSPTHLKAHKQTISKLRQIIDEENITLIHCHNPMGGVDARIAARLSNASSKVIYTAHGFHFYKGAPVHYWLCFYPVEKFLARYTDVIVTINREDYERAKAKFHLKSGGFVRQIHGVGVNTKRFCEGRDLRQSKRQELGIPDDAFHIVTAAELTPNKNQQVIIDAIGRLGKNNIYYSICGKGANHEALQNLIDELKLTDRIKLLGYRNDIEEILQTADAFAFPSHREGLGVAAVEALFCGVPVIASDNRGSREYMQDGINGYVAKSNTADEFASLIERLMNDKESYQRMAKNCRASVESFATESTMAIMREIYKNFD